MKRGMRLDGRDESDAALPAAAVQRRIESLISGLGPRDRRAVVTIVKRVAEVAEKEGQAAALRLIEQLIDIINSPDAEH